MVISSASIAQANNPQNITKMHSLHPLRYHVTNSFELDLDWCVHKNSLYVVRRTVNGATRSLFAAEHRNAEDNPVGNR